jgi:2,5-diamino-6-(ribosylamino)-4(3H)-pyrimidinone 5'-phosphate reductase
LRAARLYPLPAREIPVDAIYGDLELPPVERIDAPRPYVIINMVSSVDGKAAIGGKASRLGSQTDRQTMRNLRSKADAVMVGANTLRAEKLSLGLDSNHPDRDPLAVILTKGGALPLETNLIIGEGQELLVISPRGTALQRPEGAGHSLPPTFSQSGEVDVGEMLKMLKRDYSVDLLLVEGGPTLNHSLISANLADELFLTLAPKVVGDTRQPTIFTDPTPAIRDLTLLSAYLADEELFLRYNFL